MMKMKKISIIDGYVDEPTCLGVPPYISPYPRYIAGAIWDVDTATSISYYTIDQIRNDISLMPILNQSDVVILIAGTSVPGRYLSGYPISIHEACSFFELIPKPTTILTGPCARLGFSSGGGKTPQTIENRTDSVDLIIKGDAEIVIHDFIKNKYSFEQTDIFKKRKNPEEIKNYAIKGAKIVKQHPFFPMYLITEIETYKGCPRTIVGGCSFCSEPQKGLPQFRTIKSITSEIKALYNTGVRHFRIGNQPCIFSYLSCDSGKEEFPRPNPDALEQLFKGIRKSAPDLRTLHVDNANPGILARYPKESKKIAQTIIKYHTAGDVAAFGVESVDPIVIKQNNLKASKDEILSAIMILNDVGSKRGYNGMPHLLPGLNFLFGLKGETKKTYQKNFDFLKTILEKNLLLRRINLRQVIPLPNTAMVETGEKYIKKHKAEFQKFKRNVKQHIEQPMLKKLVPQATIIKEVYTEVYDGKLTFGRQVGSYPLLIGIPGLHCLHTFYTVAIVDYGYRSVTAIPSPVNINTAQKETLEAIPGIGKKRAKRILTKRPFKNKEEVIQALDDAQVAKQLFSYINL
jgi:radical SAM superfamily enzyme with C-terminal helix-hairpin-helix motif